MRFFFLIFCTLLFPRTLLSQANQWFGHFSYHKIVGLSSTSNAFFAAADNALFEYDLSTGDIKTITTIDGLSGNSISAFHQSNTSNSLIVGYENGLIEVVVLGENAEVHKVYDIVNKPTIPPLNKRINDFYEHDGLVYVSTNYGISQFDLDQMEFGDTFYIGTLGTQIPVLQTTVFENKIYAACGLNNGLKEADLSLDLVDFQNWNTIATGDFSGVGSTNNRLFASRANTLYSVQNSAITSAVNLPTPIIDLRTNAVGVVTTQQNRVDSFDENTGLIDVFVVDDNYQVNTAIALTNGILIGTNKQGVILRQSGVQNSIIPNGLQDNDVFSISADKGTLWATYGGHSSSFNPDPKRYLGYSYFNNELWNNVKFDSIFGAYNLNSITNDPFNNSKTFISSFGKGILEVLDYEPSRRFSVDNSGLESVSSSPDNEDVRVSALAFDAQGLLWSVSSRIARPLKSYNPNSNQWQSFDFSSIINDPLVDEFGFSDIAIASNGTKFIGGYRSGIIAFNETNGGSLIKINGQSSNLPNNYVTALAMDRQEILWVGTQLGLRVLYNTSGVFNAANPATQPIVFVEDGLPRELLEEQFISDIEVDGSNNKWIGTIGSGVYYVTSDGQRTLYHFTIDNSPLPSNNINDIALDTENGLLYLATDRGLVAFSSGGSQPLDQLDKAFVYPNPVRPGFRTEVEKVKISGLTESVNIKITDIEGNLVAEAESAKNRRFRGFSLEIDGGSAYWDGKNLNGRQVASGVYLILLSDLDTFETKVLKLLIVR